MESLVTAFPLINFSIQLMNSNEVVDMVQNNHAHIGLIEKPIETKNLHKEIVYEDQLVLAGDAASKFWLLREELWLTFSMSFISTDSINTNYRIKQQRSPVTIAKK